jgi:small subunit ribosomal protein S2
VPRIKKERGRGKEEGNGGKKRKGVLPLMAKIISMKALLESGVHFGHRTNRWNPKMAEYIFTERNGIHIIDLQQTVHAIKEVYGIVSQAVSDGGEILFVGTKRQAQQTVADEAERCGMPYVNERWLGGSLTNWPTISKRIAELERLEKMQESGEVDLLTKKEGLMIQRQIDRLHHRLSGLITMKRVPKLLFVVDIGREQAAIHEANLLKIPVIAMADTNYDPRYIDYVIPSNDDAIRAIKLIVGTMANAVLEGKSAREEEEEEAQAAAEALPAKKSQRKASKAVADASDLSDEELLGAATLKKMSDEREAAEAVAAAEENAVEEKAEEEAPKTEEAAAKDTAAEAAAAEEKAE